MQSILSGINIQQLINFITVVEYSGFQAASEQLHMTQSAISKSIDRLEGTLGFPLFIKEAKGSRIFRDACLTKEGEQLYKSWAPALNEIENSYRHILQERTTTQRTISIGYANTTDPEIYFWPFINQFRKDHDNIRFHIEGAYRTDLLSNLQDGKFDIIFVPDIQYHFINQTTMAYRHVAISNAQVLVPATNALFSKSSLTIDDIENEPFFIFHDEHSDLSQNAVVQFFHYLDIHPPIKTMKQNAFNISNAYYEDNALALVDAYINIRQNAHLKKIPLEGYYSGILCVWRKNKYNMQFMQDFLSCFPELASEKRDKLPVVPLV